MFVLANIMKSHVGEANAIKGDDLFLAIYQKEREPDYVDDFRWDYIKKAIHRLRQQTKCFVSPVKLADGDYAYFVPTTYDETAHYIKILDDNKRRMSMMQDKIRTSVQERWFELDWITESKLLTEQQAIADTHKQIKFEA